MNIGMILARKETEEDGNGKDKIIAKKISPGSLSSQVYIAVLLTEVISFLKIENEHC